MSRFKAGIAREPAAIGTVVASVLPALVALKVLSIDEQTIGLLVVAVNAIVGFAVRMFVAPTGPSPQAAQPEPAQG